MRKNNRFSTGMASKMTIGLDLGDRHSYFYTLDSSGENLESGRVQTTKSTLEKRFRNCEAARGVIEAGTHSPWVSRLLAGGRVAPQLLSPIEHRGAQAQADLAVIRARDAVVAARTQLVNHVRGAVKSLGSRMASCSTRRFAQKAAAQLPMDLRFALEPLLEGIAAMTRQINGYDRQIEDACREKYPETELLRQGTGGGAGAALTLLVA